MNKCATVSKQEISKALQLLVNEAAKSGDKNLERMLRKDISNLGVGVKRLRMGGIDDKLCHILTIAVILGGSAGLSYLTYMGIWPIVTRGMPALCEGPTDQLTGYFLSFINAGSSCAARQMAWNNLYMKVIGSIGGGTIMSLAKLREHYAVINNLLKPVCNGFRNGFCKVSNKSSKIISGIKPTLRKVSYDMHGHSMVDEISDDEIVPSIGSQSNSRSARSSKSQTRKMRSKSASSSSRRSRSSSSKSKSKSGSRSVSKSSSRSASRSASRSVSNRSDRSEKE